jgi:hypothetical protein
MLAPAAAAAVIIARRFIRAFYDTPMRVWVDCGLLPPWPCAIRIDFEVPPGHHLSRGAVSSIVTF